MHTKRAGNYTSRAKYTAWNDGQQKVKYDSDAILKALTQRNNSTKIRACLFLQS